MPRVLGVSGDFPVQLATRLPDWSAGGLLRCIVAARLSVCRVILQIPRADTRDILAKMSRGDATRKLLPWNGGV